MSRPKRDPVEVIKMRILIHFYCVIAGIERVNTELALYVENKRFSYSQYGRYITGEKTPSPKTYNKMVEKLKTRHVDKKNIDEFEYLYHLALWQALNTKHLDADDEDAILYKLPFDIQKSIATKDVRGMQLSLKRRTPCEKSVNYLERFSTFDALTALILLLRQKKGQAEKFDDAHIQLAMFRMLLSFMHHPSFAFFVEDIWAYIQGLLGEDGEATLMRMGLGFWNYSADEIKRLMEKEKAVHLLAAKAKIIEDYSDIPSFSYHFYRSDNKSAMLKAMKSIADGEPTKMMDLDNFFFKYRKTRRKGKSTIDFPTLNFLDLCIE